MNNKKIKENKSEIVNQKKQFIFEVEQSSNYVFPNEVFDYYIYIKNISGSPIEHFTIKVDDSPNINFETKYIEEMADITINPNEVKLYKLKGYCSVIGEHIVHFIGFGEGTQVRYKTLKIICTRTYNSDKTLHRVSIYDFNPYEQKYSMEADNYSNQVTQTFKKQMLPYKAKEQHFRMKQNFVPENIESESFLEQYEEAKNTKEHVYQYIGRESFAENAIESYSGENLIEIFKKINDNSKYFKAKFLKTGTNRLLNDFSQYAPNGFIYRMGLLNSEIYHTLGVIPTYSYMSDRLFRWAPGNDTLLSLIPKKQKMNWNEHVWSGRGWILYKEVTEEYSKTEEFAKKLEDKIINLREIVGVFEDEKTVKEAIKKLEDYDDYQRNKTKSSLIKYKYVAYENLYSPGVFFINIPVNKIPSNFYLMNHDDLYAIINRAKPYGTKPIINYIYDVTFNHNMNITVHPNYYKNFKFEVGNPELNYFITKKEMQNVTKECGGKEITYPALIPKRNVFSDVFNSNDMDIHLNVDLTNQKILKEINHDLIKEVNIFETRPEYKIKTLNDLLEVLYQQNYNNICFKIEKMNFLTLKTVDNENISPLSFVEEEDRLFIKNRQIECLRKPIINEKESNISIQIEDIYNKKHKINAHFDEITKMSYITYTYINTSGKEFVRQKGYQNIKSLNVIIEKIYDKKILLFMLEDKERNLHYFHHVIVQDIISVQGFKNEVPFNNFLYSNNFLNIPITFETPFIRKAEQYQPKKIEGDGWTNLLRLNEKDNSYAYNKNISNHYYVPKDISLYYDQINIPETAIIKQLRLKLLGTSSSEKNIYLKKAFNTNYLLEDMKGSKIQFAPNKIECYSHLRESSSYYETKLEIAKLKEQDTLIKQLSKLLEENYIFNEDIDVDILDYMSNPNDFITIKNEFWYELSEFTDLFYKLNEVESINFVIEGYNTEHESKILIQALSETNGSSIVEKKIPSGYFREKIPLKYPNSFLLEALRLKFRFKQLRHPIKIFDTKIELSFKNKQQGDINFEVIDNININENSYFILENDYYNPADINNGVIINLSFEDLNPGQYYHLNSTELEVIYEDTEINMMISDNRYKDIFYGINKSGVSGQVENAYLSGLFYNDVATMNQLDDNIGVDNKGIKLEDSLYQLFETRDDNITSIEIFPNGFKGNPDSTLKIGLYENSFNTPGKLIKEINVSGWLKNNEQLKDINSIKYNFNINNLKINEKYWFKIQVLSPREGNYYLLKGINTTKSGYKLLSNENNNYINTFSNLKFNIYSRNLSKSFNDLPVLQEYLDNPYVTIGLHKGQGTITNLQIDKYIKSVSGNDYMGEVFEGDKPEISVSRIIINRGKPDEREHVEEE